MSTELTKSEQTAKRLDEAVKLGCELTREIQSSFSGALRVAKVAQQIRSALTIDIVNEFIMPLKGCDFGWRTDEGNGKSYTMEQIRDVWVSAAMVGAVPVNNEVNMLVGRCYLAKNYFIRMLRDFPGLTDLKLMPGKITTAPGGAMVEYKATWNLKGAPQSIERSLPIRLNNGMGADGALGKAERKIRAAILAQITGTVFSDGDLEDGVEFTQRGDTIELHPKSAATGTSQMIQNASLPEPEKPTQTRAVVEKLKKTAAAKPDVSSPVAEAPESDGMGGEEKLPWDQNGEPLSQAPAAAAVTAVIAEQKTAPQQAQTTPGTTTPAASPDKVVGWVKDPATGEMKPVTSGENKAPGKKTAATNPPAEKKPAAAAVSAPPTPAAAPTAPAETGDGVVETDMAGKLASIRAVDKAGNPPYTITSENATQYVTDDKAMAVLAKGLKDNLVPVTVEYTKVTRNGVVRNMIVDIRPADFGSQDESQDGDEQGNFEQP